MVSGGISSFLSCFILAPYCLHTFLICKFQLSLWSNIMPNSSVQEVYFVILSPHFTGRSGPINGCYCIIIVSLFPVCIVNLFILHHSLSSSNKIFRSSTTSCVLLPITKAVVSSEYRCTSPPLIVAAKSLTYIEYSHSPSRDPCGTPYSMISSFDLLPFTSTN